uniref:Uncharacterized protein n=1 Tax=uncultured Desulfobacterium sp. TaxID=201089 RepID=E1YCK1_9BACT|nr:unknown protein [uncultured Desulfobacterium sp.]
MEISCGLKLECYTGHLTKSPCRDCGLKDNLPSCSVNCKILSKVQADLAGMISCSNNCSEFEPYSLSNYKSLSI